MGRVKRNCWLQYCRCHKCLDSGAVTVEFAVILPAVVAVAALLLGLTKAVGVSLDCQDAARAAAREIVVHQVKGNPAGVAKQVAGDQAQLSLQQSDRTVSVVFSCPVTTGSLGFIPARVSGSAVGVLNEKEE